MISAALALTCLLGGAQHAPAPVQLERKFLKGEKAEYEVRSSIFSEWRQAGLETWIPEDYEYSYRFSYEVTELKADGICEMRYKRPSITETEGETFDSRPKTKVEKLDWDLLLTVSPINEILNSKDLGKRPETKPKTGGGLRASTPLRPAQDNPISAYLGEVFRLALFVGSLDGSLDFSPKLPFDAVAPGDTWKRTAGYSPQRLQGKGDKLAVQRLDYTYTYRGIVQNGGAPVHRITADLELKTDLAAFIHQVYDLKAETSGLKEIPLTFKATVSYDLDPKTHRTLRVSAQSEGEFKVVATFLPNQAALEERFKGRTTMRLLTK